MNDSGIRRDGKNCLRVPPASKTATAEGIVWIGHHVHGPQWANVFHRHDFNELIGIVQGCERVRLVESHIEAETGDILYFAPGVSHAEQNGDDSVDLEKYFIGWYGPPIKAPVLSHDYDGRARVMLRWLVDEWRGGPRSGSGAIGTIHAALLAELKRLTDFPASSELRQLRSYIRNNVGEHLTVDTLAEQVSMSKFHFIRYYRKLSGTTPMQDVRRIRLEEARYLITTTDHPLKAVASRVGIGDESHMSKLFRAHFGVSPGYFRRARRDTITH